jgi:hypothetical protein
MLVVRVATSIVCALVLAAASGGSASAAKLPYHATSVRAAGPAASSGNVYSQGGAVLTNPAAYIVFWGSEWVTGFSSGGYTSAQAQTYTTDFFRNLGGSSWMHITTQYCQGVASGTATCPAIRQGQSIANPTGQLKGTWVDGTSLPSKIDQPAIASEATRAMQHFGYDPNATYFVYTPSKHSMFGFGLLWCGWHNSTSTSNGNIAYAYMPYQPDAGILCGMNLVNKANNAYGNGYFDGFSIVGGHEYAEAQTDPNPNSGWVDRGGSEIGDKCAWDPRSTNVTLGAHPYAVQPLWSNASSGCVVTYQP